MVTVDLPTPGSPMSMKLQAFGTPPSELNTMSMGLPVLIGMKRSGEKFCSLILTNSKGRSKNAGAGTDADGVVIGGKPCSSLFLAAATLTASAIRALASSLIGFLCPDGSLYAIIVID